MRPFHLLLGIISLFFSVVIVAQTDEPVDPFANNLTDTKTTYLNQVSLQSYYQANTLNRNNLFNPGLTKFPNYQHVSVVDWQLTSQWQSNYQVITRAIAQYDQSNLAEDSRASMLEGAIKWHSDDYRWQWQLGRIHTQWSTGFNWHLMNVLSPFRNRPYIDIDDPNQQKGWDMFTVKYQHNNWFYQLVAADYVTENDRHKLQYVARFGYQGEHDFSLLIHKLPAQDINFAASYNKVLTDHITVRMQWSQSSLREQDTHVLIESINDKHYQKFLAGIGYSFASGHELRLEYLNTEHGFREDEWNHITQQSTVSSTQITNMQGSNNDYAYLGAALSSLGRGQLRRNYLYLSYTSPLSSQLWQYRQSIQLNMDDDSQLHRLAILKSWNNSLTSRLQVEAFNGCTQCEYGLTPNKHNIRIVLNWAF